MVGQGVESVKEGLLGLVFALQELDIVNQQDVYLAVFGLKCAGAVVLNGVDEVVGELFAGYVANLDSWIKAQRVVADRVQEVGLAQPRVSIDKQRVIGLCRGLGHCERGRVGESVRGSGHEVVKVVLGVQFVVVPSARRHRGAQIGWNFDSRRLVDWL